MKKVLSLVLVLTLVLGSFGFAFADTAATTTAANTTATPKDVVGTDFEGAVTALSALGVVSGYEDGNYKPANIVTRAEMAKLIIAELGLTANANGAKSTFKDMAGYGWAEGYIGYAQSLGIINGYGDGTFKPGKTVSYDEALTMIVSALGYTKACKEMNGSWPAIYVQKARVLGITDDVKAGGAAGANRGDIAIYLYNMLTADMGYADADGVYQNKKDKDGDTIKVISNLDAEESADYAVLTKSDADNAVVNIRQYVGAYAKVFTLTKGKNDGDIIAVSDCKSDFVTGEYQASDKLIKAADGTEYKLDDIVAKGISGTSKELDSKDTAVEFVNGDLAAKGSTILKSDQQVLDADRDGAVVTVAADLSGKTIKGIFSVQLWKANNDEKVDADDIATIKNNKTLLGKEFALDDNDNIDHDSFELVGVNSLNDIKADNIVYVYTNNDDEISRVAVGTESAKGEITAIKEGSSETKVTIGGKVYLFANEKLGKYNGVSSDFDKNDVDTGDEIQAFLDAYGYMYDYDAISGKADNYAVVLEIGKAGERIGEKNQIKLFLADGTDKVFDVDNDLFKDDYVPGVTTKEAIKWEVTAGSIVKYGVDKDGLIDTFEEMTKDYKLVDQSDVVKGLSISKDGYYDNTQIKTNAVIFSFEGTKADVTAYYADKTKGVDPTDEDNYGVTTLEKVLDTSDVAVRYITDNKKISSMLLFDYSGSDEVYGVVKEARKTSGKSDYEADFYINGEKKVYGLSSESIYNKARDGAKFNLTANEKVFKLEFNASGEVKGLVPAWTDTTGDTYLTRGAIEIKANDKATFSNNTFEVTGSQSVSQRVWKDAVLYKNDGGDFKPSSLGDLKALNTGAKVWFYDTRDDDNTGLMNIVLIDNPDKEGTKPVTPSTGMGTIAVEDTTLHEIVVAGTAYSLANTSLLNDEKDATVAAGITNIETALDLGDTIDGITLDSKGKVAVIKVTRDKVASIATADAAAVDVLCNAVTGAIDPAKISAARTAYDKLGTNAKAKVTKLSMLTDGEAVAAAKSTLTLAFDTTNNATATAPVIKQPVTSGITYAEAVTDLTGNNNGGNATGVTDVTITRDGTSQFTFTLTVTITKNASNATTAFTVTVPTATGAVTIVAK